MVSVTLWFTRNWDGRVSRSVKANHDLKVFYKATHNENLSYLYNLIPNENENDRYELKHSDKLKWIVKHTTQFKDSYLPKTVYD